MGVLLLGVSYFIHFLGVELEEVGEDFWFGRVGRKVVGGGAASGIFRAILRRTPVRD